jgi:hypothetical protein
MPHRKKQCRTEKSDAAQLFCLNEWTVRHAAQEKAVPHSKFWCGTEKSSAAQLSCLNE